MFGGLYHAPVIPARIRSFLWNPADSGGIIFGRAPCQNYHSGDHLFRQNRAIPELGLEWTGTESGRMHFVCIINNQCTPHLGCFCPIGVSTGR